MWKAASEVRVAGKKSTITIFLVLAVHLSRKVLPWVRDCGPYGSLDIQQATCLDKMRKPASLCPEATLKSTIHPMEAKHGQIQMRNMFQRKSFGFHHVTIRISDDLKLQSCGAAGVAIVLSAAPKSSLFPWDDRDWKDAVFFSQAPSYWSSGKSMLHYLSILSIVFLSYMLI